MSDFEDDVSMDDFVVQSDDEESEGYVEKPKAAAKGKKAPAKKPAAKAPAKPKATTKAAAAKGKKKGSDKENVDEPDTSIDADSSIELAPVPTGAKGKAAAKTTTTKAKAPAKRGKKAAVADDDDDDDGDTAAGNVSLTAGGSTITPKGKGKGKSATETYEKLTQLEHVLKRPDTYIGSIEGHTEPMWVYDQEKEHMVFKKVTFVPGLYKIVDEILVNAADNKQRDPSMKKIDVEVNREKNLISVKNDGKGIPIEIHQKEQVYIPELIFGNLLTSSNYDDDQKKVTGGRNGYGAKLANIYSTEFTIETAGSGKCYSQTWKNNMDIKGKPIIKDKKGEYTKVSFKPDLERFGMNEIDDDTEALIARRVYDLGGCIPGVNVSLNGKTIKLKDFKAYVELYLNGENEITGWQGPPMRDVDGMGTMKKQDVICQKFGDRWEVAFTLSEGSFQQISFVNSIATTKGGNHVNYVTDQLTEKILAAVTKKNKQGAQVKQHQIKNHLWVFINCLIENPAFDSQTKENMTLTKGKFGSKCEITDDFMKKVLKSGVVDSVLHWADKKQEQVLKKTDGKSRSRLTGVAKLEDANLAGTKNSHKCTLILTEGDSAKSLAVSGIAVVSRDIYGVFPLRGKLLNVRDCSPKQLSENKEIVNIKKILGLQQGKVYTNLDGLRYGSIMIMTDQDHDGSHIKALIINLLEKFWPSLLKIPEFLVEFITPIVKATKNNTEKCFFTIPEYLEWKDAHNDGRGWKIKYFKGLGTSDSAAARKYFTNMPNHRFPFRPIRDDERDLVDMVFNKKKADERKDWLAQFVPGTYLEHNVDEIKIDDFVHKELILFSMADNIRSIPSLVDGFKPSQRKVLFACFKRKLKGEVKVTSLAGYTTEHAAYHHGDASLSSTILGLAADFLGSNNINLLVPSGQFGSRATGGKDAASPRYLFTALTRITRTIFHPHDDSVLTYLNDDGQSVEPEWYLPVIPMVLVNGSSGIGTGWSSTIPTFNPEEIVENLRRKMNGEEMIEMHPWYRGFTGTIEKIAPEKYKCTGTINVLDEETVEITELPPGKWTQNYKEDVVEAYTSGGPEGKYPIYFKSFKEYHSDTRVHFIITLNDKGKEQMEKEGMDAFFKLSNQISISNMVAFNVDGKLKKYSKPGDIIEEFYDIRLTYYQKRKEHLADELTIAYERLSNQARFILMIVDKSLSISNRKKKDIVAELRKLDFRPFPKQAKAVVVGDPDENQDEDEDAVEETANTSAAGSDSDFDYLLNMSLYNLTKEKVDKLLNERDTKEQELTTLLKLTPKDIWSTDLDEFMIEYQAVLEYHDKITKAGAKNLKGGAGKGRKKIGADDSDDDFKPTKRKAPAKPRAKKEDPDDGLVAASKAKPAAKKAPRKRTSGDLGLSDDDAGPSKKVAKAKKTSTAKDSKPIELDDDDGDEPPVKGKGKANAKAKKEEDDESVVPVKKPSKGKATTKVESDVEMEEVPPPKKAAAKPKAKPKKKTTDDDEDDAFELDSKPGPSKPKSKAKKVKDESEDEDDVPAPVKEDPPPRRAARAAAAKKPKYVVDIDDSEASENFDFGNDDEGSEGYMDEDED